MTSYFQVQRSHNTSLFGFTDVTTTRRSWDMGPIANYCGENESHINALCDVCALFDIG